MLNRTSLKYANNAEETIKLIQSAVRVILIVSTAVGKNFIMTYYNGLKTFDNVKYIFAYCENVKGNEEFYGKLKQNPIEKVHNSATALLKDLLDHSDKSVLDSIQ